MNPAYKILTHDEFLVLVKVATKSGSDEWFYLRRDKQEENYVYNLHEKKKMCLKAGVKLLMDAVEDETVFDNCNLTPKELNVLCALLGKLEL